MCAWMCGLQNFLRSLRGEGAFSSASQETSQAAAQMQPAAAPHKVQHLRGIAMSWMLPVSWTRKGNQVANSEAARAAEGTVRGRRNAWALTGLHVHAPGVLKAAAGCRAD